MSIHHWPAGERPREKLIEKGAKALSDAELLAIFLRVGVRGKSAVDLARDLLVQFGTLGNLLNVSYEDFCAKQGLGPAKYVQLQAALELVQRCMHEALPKRDVMRNPCDVYRFLRHRLRHKPYEIFACLFLNKKNHLLAYEELFEGTIDSSHVYPREVVKKTLEHDATQVIFCHNHPSGDIKPSDQDLNLTQLLKSALKLINVSVLDHVIIGGPAIFSFAGQGLL